MDRTIRIYSKLSILLFSTFGSIFFGSILYTMNLKETKNERFIFPTIIFSLIYSFLAGRLPLFLNIPIYYSFIPLHFIGGLAIVGPFWKYQIGVLENFQKRKIWGPLVVLVVPLALIVFLNIYKFREKSTSKEYTEANKLEVEKQLKNKVFVSKDSMVQFFDISVPLLDSSFTFQTKVDDLNTLYDYVDYEEGRYSIVCMRIHLSDDDKFGLDLLGEEYSFSVIKDCNNENFKEMLCADYKRKNGDEAFVNGTVAMIKIGYLSYIFMTQYIDLNKESADKLSNYLINKIKSAY